jgi:hypothetical protein
VRDVLFSPGRARAILRRADYNDAIAPDAIAPEDHLGGPGDHKQPISPAGANRMNDTLSKIRQKAGQTGESQILQQESKDSEAARRAKAAEPLLTAFRDIQNEFVKIDLLKQIWPNDFDRRNDRLLGLLSETLGDPRYPHGIKLLVPGGFRSFSVDFAADGNLLYTSAREPHSGRAQYVNFQNEEQWMEFFYKTMAYILEV